MNTAEMTRRLNTMTDDDRARVRRLVRQGYGASGIRNETGLPLRLINAVFQQVNDAEAERAYRMRNAPAMDSADLARANID